MKTTWQYTVACIAAIVIALSGCGSSTDDSASSENAAETSTAAVDSVRPQPPATGPDESGPAVTGPETTGPHTTDVETTAPETTAPATTEPATTEPAITQPETTIPATLAPPIVAGFAQIALTEPGADATASTPLFGWQPVDGAVRYRLVVVGPAGPIWSWEGDASSVRLGGLAGERPAGFGGPVIVDGSSWSVVALDAAGQVVAVSERRSLGAA